MDDAHVVPIGPELDLHSFAPRDISDVVDAYLEAAHAAGLRDVRLVHGRGIGVQRARVRQVLGAHRLVASFHDDPRSHLGATIVALIA
jgi:DNA-nicking Smr family endonuclease